MQNTSNQVIVDFIKNRLSPLPEEREMISRRYDELQKFLDGNTFQNGSYARHTSTTPVNDLDVFYVLPSQVMKALAEARVDPDQLDIKDILNSLAKQLEDCYGREATIKVQPHSVGIFFGSEADFSIDVVPAQPLLDGKFLVPESAHLSVYRRREFYKSGPSLRWIKSDPKGYNNQATALDDTTKGTFRKAAKFVKKWRLGCKRSNNDFPLKSFHLEIAVTELMKRQPTLNCLQVVDTVLTGMSRLFDGPQFTDLADSSRYIDEYVSTIDAFKLRLVETEQVRLVDQLNKLRNATTTTAVLKAVDEILQLNETRSITAPTAIAPRRTEEYSKPYRP